MTSLTITVNGEKTQAHITKKIHERIIINFLDLIVMTKLKEQPSNGYNLISLIKNKYGFLISSSTVYSLLYSLERSKLIASLWDENKRVYTITDQGKQTLETIKNSKNAYVECDENGKPKSACKCFITQASFSRV
jgi:DNA-binding PadR family transcriptional regulator